MMYLGVVESRDDPLKLARVRVRVFDVHTDDIEVLPTNDLPWAHVLHSGAATSDVGDSVSGLVVGSWVVVTFLNEQTPLIMGALHGHPIQGAVQGDGGFVNASGEYPRRFNESDVNRLARNDATPHDILAFKENTRTTSVPVALSETTWNEPASAYNTVYPYNVVWESESGHIRECDDTPGAERTHEYHKAGTFTEIDANGQRVTRIVSDNYTIVAGTDYAYIAGDVNLTIGTNCNTRVAGNWNIEVGQDMTIDVGGTLDIDTVDNTTIDSGDSNGRGSGLIFFNSSGES